MITSKTQLNAVIGLPIGHSKSPVLHNALYKKLRIDAAMLAFSNKNVKNLIQSIKVLNIGLTAVTMPFKQTVIPYLDKIDENAKSMNAVNTIINERGLLKGYNTDIDGIALALRGLNLKSKNVLIVGAGGAARAVAYFIKLRKGKIFYFNRTTSNAEKLRSKFGGKVLNESELETFYFHLIVNSTPIGMHPNIAFSPVLKTTLKKHQYVFDLVYNPLQTKFLKEAKAAGAKPISGIDMFAGQALKQIELYSGRKILTSQSVKLAKKILLENLI